LKSGGQNLEKPIELKFECQGSGKCCVHNGENGFVFLTDADAKRLELFTHMNRTEFSKTSVFNFTRFRFWTGTARHLTNSEKQCRFLKRGKCSVYEARPQQCRTWPFYPEHMNPKKWATVAKFCPGIGKGPERDPAEVQTIIDAQTKSDKEY